MRILNFGSLNVDHIYEMDHFAAPKETQAALHYRKAAGGKGLNQSIALARAGIAVYHAGCIGSEGLWLKQYLRENGVDVRFIQEGKQPGGHAIIQVCQGENSIIVYGGANQCVELAQIDDVLSHFNSGDILLVQNEISRLDQLMCRAHALGMRIVLNPSPFDAKIANCPLDLVDTFLLNEVEAALLAGGCGEGADEVLSRLRMRYPLAKIVMTMGEKGVYYQDPKQQFYQEAIAVKAVDTTCAGDTFTGYFLAGVIQGRPLDDTLRLAAWAAALSVQRHGAAQSIPKWEEVMAKGGTV